MPYNTHHAIAFVVIECGGAPWGCVPPSVAMARGRVATSSSIYQVKCRGKPAGFRAYVGGKYVSFHKSRASAKAAIAKALAIASKGLGSTPRPRGKAKSSTPQTSPESNSKAKLGSTPLLAPVLHQWIVPKLGVDGVWRYHGKIRQPGTDTKLYAGSSTNQKTVACQVAQVMGRDGGPLVRWKCARRSAVDAIDRFKLLTAMFKGWRPRDLVGAVQRRAQATMMMVQAPGLYVAFLMGREHAWRDSLLKTWEASDYMQRLCIAGMDSNDEPVQLEASQAMHKILSDVFKEWGRQTRLDPGQRNRWKEHVDRNVSHHLSLTAWGLREGMLKKVTDSAGSLGVRNQSGEWYGVCGYDRQVHNARIRQMHRLGRMLLPMRVPRTNQEWLASMQDFGRRCADAGINSGKTENHYQFWWLARVHLIVEMRHRRIERLRVVADWDKDEVTMAMVLDMSDWLTTWITAAQVEAMSLKQLLSKLSYREPLEMLSCFCCILGDTSIDRFSIEELQSARDAICERRRCIREESIYEDEGNPTIIIRSAMGLSADASEP